MLLIALIVGLIWPPLALKYLLYPQLTLTNDSMYYDIWIKSPIPIYFEFFFFNWTNHEKIHNHSIKPHFTEMGPYVFR